MVGRKKPPKAKEKKSISFKAEPGSEKSFFDNAQEKEAFRPMFSPIKTRSVSEGKQPPLLFPDVPSTSQLKSRNRKKQPSESSLTTDDETDEVQSDSSITGPSASGKDSRSHLVSKQVTIGARSKDESLELIKNAKSNKLTKPVEKKFQIPVASGIDAETVIVKKGRGRPKLSLDEKKQKFDKDMEILDKVLLEGLAEFKDFFTQYVQTNFNVATRVSKQNKTVIKATENRVNTYLKLLAEIAQKAVIEPSNLHLWNYRTIEARTIDVATELQDSHNRRRDGQISQESTHTFVNVSGTSKQQTTSRHLRRSVNFKECVMLQTDKDVNDATVAIGIVDALERKKDSGKSEYPRNMHDNVAKYRGIRIYQKLLILYEAKLEKEKYDGIEYPRVDKELDRFILRAVLPDCVRDLRKYERTMFMSMCLRKEMVPISELGFRQFFDTLRNVMNESGETQVWMTKLQETNIDLSRSDLTLEDLKEILTKLIGVESLEMSILLLYHLEGRWTFCRDFLKTHWRERNDKEPHGKYKSSLLKVEMHDKMKLVRGEDPNCPLSDEFINREVMKWRYIKTNGLLEDCDLDSEGKPIVAKGKRKYDEASGNNDEVMDIDEDIPLTKAFKSELANRGRGRGGRNRRGSRIRARGVGRSVVQMSKSPQEIATTSSTTAIPSTGADLTTEELQNVKLNACSKAAVEKAYQRALKCMLEQTYYNVPPEKLLRYGYIITRPRYFFHTNPVVGPDIDNPLMDFVISLLRVSQEYTTEYDFFHKVLGPDCNLSNYTGKFAEILNGIQRGNPADQRYSMGLSFPQFARETVTLAIWPAKCPMKASNYYIGAVTKGITDKKPFFHLYFQCTDPWCNVRAYFIIPDQPQPGMKVRIVVSVVCTDDHCPPFAVCSLDLYPGRKEPQDFDSLVESHWNIFEDQKTTGAVIDKGPEETLNFLNSPAIAPYDTIDTIFKKKAGFECIFLPFSVRKSVDKDTGEESFYYPDVGSRQHYRSFKDDIHVASKNFSKGQKFQSSTINGFLEEIKSAQLSSESEPLLEPVKVKKRLKKKQLIEAMAELRLEPPEDFREIVKRNQKVGYEHCYQQQGAKTNRSNYSIAMHRQAIVREEEKLQKLAKESEQWQMQKQGLHPDYTDSNPSDSGPDTDVPFSYPSNKEHRHLAQQRIVESQSYSVRSNESEKQLNEEIDGTVSRVAGLMGPEEVSENLLDLTKEENMGMVEEPLEDSNQSEQGKREKSPNRLNLSSDSSSVDHNVDEDDLNLDSERSMDSENQSVNPLDMSFDDLNKIDQSQVKFGPNPPFNSPLNPFSALFSSEKPPIGFEQTPNEANKNNDQRNVPHDIISAVGVQETIEHNDLTESNSETAGELYKVERPRHSAVIELMNDIVSKIEERLEHFPSQSTQKTVIFGREVEMPHSDTGPLGLDKVDGKIMMSLVRPEDVLQEIVDTVNATEDLPHNTTDDSIHELFQTKSPNIRNEPAKPLIVEDVIGQDFDIKCELLRKLQKMQRGGHAETVDKLMDAGCFIFEQAKGPRDQKILCQTAGMQNVKQHKKTVGSLYKEQKKWKLRKKVNPFIKDHDLGLPQTITDMIKRNFGSEIHELPVSKSRFDPLHRRIPEAVAAQVTPFLSNVSPARPDTEIDIGLCVVENEVDERLTINGITVDSMMRHNQGEVMTRCRRTDNKFIPSEEHFTARDTVKILKMGPPVRYDELFCLDYNFPVHFNKSGIELMKLFAKCLNKLPYGCAPCNPGIEQGIYERMDLTQKIETCGEMFTITMLAECNLSGHLVKATIRLSECINWDKTFMDQKYDIPEFCMEVIKAQILAHNPDITGLRVSKFLREYKNVVVGWSGQKIVEIWCEQNADYVLITNIDTPQESKGVLSLSIYNFRTAHVNLNGEVIEAMAASLKPQHPFREIRFLPRINSQTCQDDWHSSGPYCIAHLAYGLKTNKLSDLIIKPDKSLRSHDLRKHVCQIFIGHSIERILDSPLLHSDPEPKSSGMLILLSALEKEKYMEQIWTAKLCCYPNCRLSQFSLSSLKRVVLCQMCQTYYHNGCLRGLYIKFGTTSKQLTTNPSCVLEVKDNDYFICCVCMETPRGPLRLDDPNSDLWFGGALHALIYERQPDPTYTVKDVFNFCIMIDKKESEITKIQLYDRYLELASSNRKKLQTGLVTLPCWLTDMLFDTSGLVVSDVDSKMYTLVCMEIQDLLSWRDEIVLFPTVQGQMFMIVCYKKSKKVIIFNPMLRSQSSKLTMDHELKFTGAVATTIVDALRFIDQCMTEGENTGPLWNGYVANHSPWCLEKYESMAVCCAMFYQMSSGLPFHYISSLTVPFWFQYILRTVLTKTMHPDITKSETVISFEDCPQLTSTTELVFPTKCVNHEHIPQVRVQAYKKNNK